ncbi:MAG: NADH-quinone oxidoreductase subunit NuoN [Gemmobacter sp.]
MTPADFNTILPEVMLAIFAMAALLGGVYTTKDKAAPLILWLTAAVMVVLAAWIGLGGNGERSAFGGMFIDDPFARFAKVTILLSAAAILIVGQDHLERRGLLRFEYPILVALSVLGMMVMVSAGDLIALYMGLELQSLALYVIAAMRRDSVKSTEAGLKYFVLGSLSSGLFLYGASLTYGYAGTTVMSGILESLDHDAPLGLLFGLVFMISALAFKVSAAPFHMWTPDVYEGAPTPVTAFFATAPKMAAMALLGRLMLDAFGTIPADWGQVIAALSVVSMFVGAIAAIGQRDIKRLMAYSSIAHMGFALMGLAAASGATPEVAAQGVQAMLLYMAIYVAMNIGTFAFILSMEREGRAVSDIGSLNMLSKRAPTTALALLVLMFSLAGVPPMLGFFAKFAVLEAAVKADMAWLATAGVIASVIGAFYYLRIVYFMYFGAETAPLDTRMAPAPWLALVASAIVMLAGIVNLFGVEGAAAVAAEALVR